MGARVNDSQMTSGVVAAEGRRWQRRAARLMRRYAWSGVVIQRLMRRIQPRFTAGVVGVVLDGRGRVLLVEHVFHTRYPWGLPGGWINRHEDPAQTAEREIREETSLRVRAVRPLVIQRGATWPRHLDIVFLCELDGDDQRVHLNGELLSYRGASCDTLPPLIAFHQQGIEAARLMAGR